LNITSENCYFEANLYLIKNLKQLLRGEIFSHKSFFLVSNLAKLAHPNVRWLLALLLGEYSGRLTNALIGYFLLLPAVHVLLLLALVNEFPADQFKELAFDVRKLWTSPRTTRLKCIRGSISVVVFTDFF
jgi:hypothetical protein